MIPTLDLWPVPANHGPDFFFGVLMKYKDQPYEPDRRSVYVDIIKRTGEYNKTSINVTRCNES